MPSRRAVLTGGLAGATLLAVGGVGLSLRPGRLWPTHRPLLALDERRYSVVAALAETVTPGTTDAPSATDLDVAHDVDALIATLHPGLANDLRALLGLLENAALGLVFDGRAQPFTTLDAAGRREALDAWRTSAVQLRRQGYKALRGVCAAAWAGHPEAHAAMGYPGPPQALLDALAAP